MKPVILGIYLFPALGLLPVHASPAGAVNEGNRLYREGKYQEALAAYGRAAQEDPESARIFFNLGTALFRLGDLEKAAGLFQHTAQADDPELLPGAWYNLGNSLLAQEKLEESLQAYRRAIELDPADLDAKYNFEVARQRLQQQQQQQQQQEQEQQQQEQQQQEQQQQQDQPQEQEDSEQGKEPEEKPQEAEAQEDTREQEQPPPPERRLETEDVERLLDSVAAEEEARRQEEKNRQAGAAEGVYLDW